MIRKRIFVVLGMHRSGTSAVARGLAALGVDLGDRLMPPAPGNNERGFFEDVEASALNDEILAALGRRWDSLAPISAAMLEGDELDAFRLRAIEFLRERLATREVYGLKDPRISILLPFWQRVFEHLGLDDAYVLSLRHPLSVASSLRKRDGFDTEKSLYLWLEHTVACYRATSGRRRIVVDFDELMASPERELTRVGGALGLDAPRPEPLAEYSRQFLSEQLRHTHYEAGDLRFGDEIPAAVVDAFNVLHEVARDRRGADDKAVRTFFDKAADGIDAMRPALGYMSRQWLRAEVLGAQVSDLQAAVRGRDDLVASLNNAGAVRDARAHELNALLAEREQRLQAIQAVVQARDEVVASLHNAAAVRDARAHELKALLDEREQRLEASRAKRERVVADLTAALEAKTREYEALEAERSAEIHALGLELNDVHRRAQDLNEARLELRQGLEAQLAAQAEGCTVLAKLLGKVRFPGPAPSGFDELLEASRQLPDRASRLRQRLHQDGLAEVVRESFDLNNSMRSMLSRALPEICQCTAEVARRADIERLRLVDALRQSERAREQVAALGEQVAALGETIAALRAETAALRSQSAELAGALQQREAQLATQTHRMASRLELLLQSHPAVRLLLTGPKKLLQRMLPQARA